MVILIVIILSIGQLKIPMLHGSTQCKLKDSLYGLVSIWSEGVIGPYFFDDTVTAQSYLTMLNDYFYPVYRDLSDNESIFFMQDGAPAHYASDVREWLDENFSGR